MMRERRLLIWLPCAAIISLALWKAVAVETNDWPFSDPINYTPSDLGLIEVRDDVAKLVIQPAFRHHNTIADYTQDGTNVLNAVMGTDAVMTLQKVSGQFQGPGTFISRFHDGGIGLNEWRYIHASAAPARSTVPKSAARYGPAPGNQGRARTVHPMPIVGPNRDWQLPLDSAERQERRW